jgi:tagatose 1,6-diphosphate aldolase
MQIISIGKLRGLQQISSPRGVITALALDHRQNLRKANPAFVDDALLSRFKLDVARALASRATAVLLDPEVSAAQAVAARAVPKRTGLVVALESTGYTGDAAARRPRMIPGWSVAKAKRMGASAAKLLVYYHPEAETAAETEDFVRAAANECGREDLPLMLEALSYSPDPDHKLSSTERRDIVLETARRLTPLGVDILKAEFPLDPHDPDESGWLGACRDLTSASSVPWILLSAAVDFETYLRQVGAACRAGASGIAVGRAVWQEAIPMPPVERAAFLRRVARPRLARLGALCTALARPLTGLFSAEAPFDWYSTYGG